MKYLIAMVCMMCAIQAGSQHLHGMNRFDNMPALHMTGMPLDAGFWTGSNGFRGGATSGIIPQQRWNSFGQLPQTWGTQNRWSNGFPLGDRGFRNNGPQGNDPWEQYRKFSSGAGSIAGITQTGTGGVSTNANQPSIQLPGTFASNNYPWNTFATQNWNINVPMIPNNVNGAFGNTQMQSHFNPGLLNNQFPNGAFISGGLNDRFPNGASFSGVFNQRFSNGIPVTNGLRQGFPNVPFASRGAFVPSNQGFVNNPIQWL